MALMVSLALLLAIIVALNFWATRILIRDDLTPKKQRLAQVVFVWCIPIVGALFATYMKRGEPEPPSGRYGEPLDAGDDFGQSGNSYCRTKDAIAGTSSDHGLEASSD